MRVSLQPVLLTLLAKSGVASLGPLCLTIYMYVGLQIGLNLNLPLVIHQWASKDVRIHEGAPQHSSPPVVNS